MQGVRSIYLIKQEKNRWHASYIVGLIIISNFLPTPPHKVVFSTSVGFGLLFKVHYSPNKETRWIFFKKEKEKKKYPFVVDWSKQLVNEQLSYKRFWLSASSFNFCANLWESNQILIIYSYKCMGAKRLLKDEH